MCKHRQKWHCKFKLGAQKESIQSNLDQVHRGTNNEGEERKVLLYFELNIALQYVLKIGRSYPYILGKRITEITVYKRERRKKQKNGNRGNND